MTDKIPRLEKIRVLQSKTGVSGVGWSPDGRMLASYSNFGGLISLWNVDGTHIRDIERRGTYVQNSILFVSGGRQLLTPATINSREDNQFAFTLWNVETGAAERNILSPGESWKDSRVVAFALSPDGRTVAAISNASNGPVTVYSTEDWSILRNSPISAPHPGATLVGPPLVAPSMPTSVAFSPDSSLLAVGLLTGNVAFLNLRQSDTPTDPLPVYTRSLSIYSLAFSPDGRFVATGAAIGAGSPPVQHPIEDASLKIWRTPGHELAVAYPGRLAPVRQLSWSPDGRFLAAATDGDHTLRVFSPAEPTREPSAAAFDQPLASGAFSPDGRLLAAAAGNAVTIFKLEP